MAMSKRWTSFGLPALALAMIAAPLGGSAQAQTQAQAQQACAALTITGHPSYPPVAWAVKGKIVGVAPTLVRGIAEKLGVKKVVSKDFGSWEAAQDAARKGEADVIFGIYKNDARIISRLRRTTFHDGSRIHCGAQGRGVCFR